MDIGSGSMQRLRAYLGYIQDGKASLQVLFRFLWVPLQAFFKTYSPEAMIPIKTR